MGNNHCRALHAPKTLIALVAVASLVSCEQPVAPDSLTPPVFGFGNGAPTGAHYNLNWIGVPQGKTADMTGSNGHVIFVALVGNTKILLCESGRVGTDCANVSGFQVLDANGTDGFASFALPNPDPNNTGTALYSVYVRALGTPGGTATNTTCGVDPLLPSDTICSVLQLDLTAHGQKTFQNVTKEMLYVYAILPGQTTISRVPLFDSRLQNYFWNYDNNGLKLAQFRFYPVPTPVP